MPALALVDAIYSNAPVGLGFWDAELRFVRVNERLAEINGVDVDEHVGKTVPELLGAFGQRIESMLRQVRDSGEPVVSRELTGRTPATNGRSGHWLASFYPVRAASGELLGVGAVVVDVTAQREARRRAEVLARVGAALSASIRQEGVLEALVDATVPALADWCAIHLDEASGPPKLLAVAHLDPDRERLAWKLDERYPVGRRSPSPVAAVIRSGRPQVRLEVTEEMLATIARDDEHLRLLRELQIRSAAVLPLRARGRTIGAITMAMAESGRRYDAEAVELAESVASQAATALDNARLYTEIRDVAETLQRRLLPASLPAVPRVEAAASYRSAGRANEVGGDFYDLFSDEEGVWAFVIGDVVGKGPEAAALTALVRYTLQAGNMEGLPPAGCVRLAHEALVRRTSFGQFCTAVFGHLRPSAGGAEVRLVRAGHPPPLVVRGDGRLDRMEAGGPLLGIYEDVEFAEVTVELAPGDLLLLYTDGAFELRGASRYDEEERFHACVREAAGGSAQALVDRIEHEALVLSRGEPRDDLAVLALRVLPSG